jgi:hypothetical protein
LFAAIGALALLIAAGIAFDLGGSQIRAMQLADGYAEEAARTGGQAVAPGVIQGQRPTLDRNAAIAAARAYLNSAGVTGSIRITGAQTLEVNTQVTRPTVFLPLIGITHVRANGHATARIARGVGEEEP